MQPTGELGLISNFELQRTHILYESRPVGELAAKGV